MLKLNKNIFIAAIILLVSIIASISVKAQSSVGDWKIHSTWDNFYEKVIDTPTRTYFQIPGTGTWAGAVGYEEKRSSLFVYDKESEEMYAYTSLDYLNGDVINYISYNYDKGYLLIVYIDSNIDILYDDDTVYNIPDYIGAIMTTDKCINHATFDDENNRIYLATDFGYLVINDEKYEIAESHIYNTQINAVGRVGDKIVLLTPEKAYQSPISDPHLSLSSFTAIEEITGAKFLMPLTDNMFGFANPRLKKATFDNEGKVLVEELRNTDANDVHECIDGGYFILEGLTASMLKKDGYVKTLDIPDENNGTKFSSYNFEEFWFTYSLKGYCSRKYDSNTKEWTVTRDYTMPSAPAVFYSVYPTPTKDYGMVIAGSGINNIFSTNWVDLSLRMSGYKDMEWTNYGPIYISSNPLESTVADTNGPSFDPLAPNYAYFGTYRHGMVRLNFEDKDDIELYSYATHPSKNLDGFHTVFPTSSWQYCNIKKPEFDANNTMWIFHEVSSVANGTVGFWYWESEQRKTNNASAIKFLPVKGMNTFWAAVFKSLKKNKTILVQAPGSYDGPMCVFDHNGTLDNTSDDRVVNLNNIYDQDGNLIPKTYIYCFYEDLETGKVWVGTFNGVFCFNPKDAFNENFRAQRIKVARNDGTNLADYLLDGIPVYDIKSDGAGRKWFATGGSGVVITSADGSEVISQMTAENTSLPNDNVYSIGINPTSNSVFLSTYYGLAEYFSDATPAQPTYDNVIAYPNPVRPDYLGWVTIEGLMNNSLVKIVDASGGFVKDLGLSQGGMISWDVTNESGKRVKTGVYYVVASQSEDGGSAAKVTKILVVN